MRFPYPLFGYQSVKFGILLQLRRPDYAATKDSPL